MCECVCMYVCTFPQRSEGHVISRDPRLGVVIYNVHRD